MSVNWLKSRAPNDTVTDNKLRNSVAGMPKCVYFLCITHYCCVYICVLCSGMWFEFELAKYKSTHALTTIYRLANHQISNIHFVMRHAMCGNVYI